MLTDADLPEGFTLAQLSAWYDSFRFYRHSPSREEVLAWVKQFDVEHFALAAKVLDQVILISDLDIQQGYHDALAKLPGWSLDDKVRKGKWAFVGLGGQAESGPAMLHMFREANGLTSDLFQSLFVTPADLPELRLTAHDTVVFVDDFSGTGDQFSKRWALFQELVSSEARTYLFLAAATHRAMKRLQSLDDITIEARLVLGPDSDVFSAHNTVFSDDDKAVLLGYCRRADRSNPKGWGNCGLLLVISRKTPNNSIPVLHVSSKKWKGIFPRKLQIVKAAKVAA
jgi:hypothetical protein